MKDKTAIYSAVFTSSVQRYICYHSRQPKKT